MFFEELKEFAGWLNLHFKLYFKYNIFFFISDGKSSLGGGEGKSPPVFDGKPILMYDGKVSEGKTVLLPPNQEQYCTMYIICI